MSTLATTSTRRDQVPLRMGATPVEVRPDGSKVYEGIAAFGDVVAPYPDLVPPRDEFRPADEVMSPEALKSLEGLRFTGGLRSRDWDGKVTLPGDHTPELDDPDGTAIEGVVLRGWREDKPGEPPALRVRVIAHTRAMQALLEGGTRGLSLGYVADEDKTPGVHKGRPYQVVQRRHRYYHLAAVSDPRSKTPSGRGARLDASPHKTSSYSPHAKGKISTMKRKPSDITPLATLALAVLASRDAPTGPRFDAMTLSPADAELLKQMSPEVQAALASAMGGEAMLEAGGAEAEAAGEEMAAGEDSPAEDVAEADAMAALSAKVDLIVAALEAANIKVGMPTADALPPAACDAAPKMDAKNTKPTAPRQDATVTTPAKTTAATPAFDSAEVIRLANEATDKRFDANAALVGAVRKDHSGVSTVTEAVTQMLVVIKGSLPMLLPTAEEHVKAHRMDSLRPIYEQAETLRRREIMDSQRQSLRGFMDHAGAGNDFDSGQPDASAPKGDGFTRAPLRANQA